VGHPEQTLTRSTISGLARSLAGHKGAMPGVILYGPLAFDLL
jgi:uroporphyrin-III C-methyltransferase